MQDFFRSVQECVQHTTRAALFIYKRRDADSESQWRSGAQAKAGHARAGSKFMGQDPS